MIERAAFFAQKQEVEDYFVFKSDSGELFEPDYNIPAGGMVPVIISGDREEGYIFKNLQWGNTAGNKLERISIEKENVQKVLNENTVVRCIIPLSGFYIWKNGDKKGSPFFVRMLNEPLMAVAGIYYQNEGYVLIVTTDSNPLIQPMSEKMPFILNRYYAAKWIDNKQNTDTLIKEGSGLYLLTDLSVMRVSKKVNDTSNNSQKLIQPIPK
jgi:putative SOS response-associated peptidase YedK